MNPLKRRLLWLLSGTCFLLLLEFSLARWMVDRQVVSTILAAGSHVPPLTFALAALFVVVRFSAVFLLPGSILARLAVLAFDWWRSREPEPPPAAPAGKPEPTP